MHASQERAPVTDPATDQPAGDTPPRRAFQIADLPERYAVKITVDPESDCWRWQTVRSNGYGVIQLNRRALTAHRIIYELLAEPIPDDLTLDHLCHPGDGSCPPATCLHRRCVNPAHLEPITNRENILRGNGVSAVAARKTHCPKGHPYSEENTRIETDGSRKCRTCDSLRSKEKRRREALNRKPRNIIGKEPGKPVVYGSLIAVRLPAKLDTAIRQMAAQQGITPTKLMRQLAQAEVSRREASEGEAVA